MIPNTITNQNRRFLVFIFMGLTIASPPISPVFAFDDDRNISDIQLKEESFLDINAYQFRKTLDLSWWNTQSGWRATGGSVSTDRLYLLNEFRLHKQLFDALSIGIRYEQENFYAKKPAPQPLMFIDIYPQPEKNYGISLVGTPAYDKRQSDMGYAVTFGRQPNNFVRLTWLKVDKFYNDKNEFDNSYYDKYGETLMLEGTYKFHENWIAHFDFVRDTPLDFVFDDQTSRFLHESYDYQASLVYRHKAQSFSGLSLRTLNVDKQLQEISSDRDQKIDYQMLEIYWVNQGFDGNRELTLGIRYDTFREDLRDNTNPGSSYDFKLSTWQAYATLFNSYDLHQAWELGVYLGWSDRSKRYNASSVYEFNDDSTQAKLRTSWLYYSIDRSNTLSISATFNIDDLTRDPWDGGGVYMQTQF